MKIPPAPVVRQKDTYGVFTEPGESFIEKRIGQKQRKISRLSCSQESLRDFTRSIITIPLGALQDTIKNDRSTNTFDMVNV
jgi:hypothetical protein